MAFKALPWLSALFMYSALRGWEHRWFRWHQMSLAGITSALTLNLAAAAFCFAHHRGAVSLSLSLSLAPFHRHTSNVRVICLLSHSHILLNSVLTHKEGQNVCWMEWNTTRCMWLMPFLILLFFSFSRLLGLVNGNRFLSWISAECVPSQRWGRGIGSLWSWAWREGGRKNWKPWGESA